MRFRLTPRLTTPTASSVRCAPTAVRVRARPLRVLDVDVEARPLHWIGGDYVSKEITAMAWAWTDAPEDVSCFVLGDTDPAEMLRAFLAVYRHADLVTGHFLRGYDLPLINGALTEYQLPSLTEKLTHDTKLDLVRRQGLSSSQENLGAMLALEHPKVQMDQAKWRAANRLTPEGQALVRARVTGDVRQHMELRRRLLELGYLGPPKRWRPGVAQVAIYTP